MTGGFFLLPWCLCLMAAPPEITIQPVDLAIEEGSTARFRVFTPDPTASYQWYRNGMAIPGATESVYHSYNASLSECAKYRARLKTGPDTTWSREVELVMSPQDRRAGMIDTSFSVKKINGGGVGSLARDSMGRIYLGGLLDVVDGKTSMGLARVDHSGQVDMGFTAAFDGEVKSVLVFGDGVLVGGNFGSCNGVACGNFVKLDEAGGIEESFGEGFNDEVNVMTRDRDGRVYVGGRFTRFQGSMVKQVVRLDAELRLDAGFVAEGIDAAVQDVLLFSNDSTLPLEDERVLVSGGFSGRIKKLQADGSADGSFTNGLVTNGIVTDLALDDEQRILAVNSLFPPLVRLENDGRVDPSFMPNPNDFVFDVAVAGSGIYLAGDFTSISGKSVRGIARLTESGAVDGSFMPPALDGPVNTMIIRDGTILIGGDFQFPHSDTMRLRLYPLEAGDGAPMIQCHPQAREILPGGEVTLRVVADGATKWQWLREGSMVPGATEKDLIVKEAGDYQVVVSNAQGSNVSEIAKVEVVALSTGLPVSRRYEAAPQMLELDNETTISISVNDEFEVSRVRVHLVFRHEKINDFTADLESPNGTVTRLFRRPGRRGIDLIATLDDEGIGELEDAAAPWHGTWKPDAPLAPHNGQVASGVWKLHITKRNRPNDPLGAGFLEKCELELVEHRLPDFEDWQEEHEGGLLDFALLQPLDPEAGEIEEVTWREDGLHFCHYRWANVPSLEYRYETLEGTLWKPTEPEVVEIEDYGNGRQYLHLRLPSPTDARLIRLRVRQE